MQAITSQRAFVQYAEWSARYPPPVKPLPAVPGMAKFTTSESPTDCLLSHYIPSPSLPLCHAIGRNQESDHSYVGRETTTNRRQISSDSQFTLIEHTRSLIPPVPQSELPRDLNNWSGWTSSNVCTEDSNLARLSPNLNRGNTPNVIKDICDQFAVEPLSEKKRRAASSRMLNLRICDDLSSIPSLASSCSSASTSVHLEESCTNAKDWISSIPSSSNMTYMSRSPEPNRYQHKNEMQYISAPIPNVVPFDSNFQKNMLVLEGPDFYPKRPAPYPYVSHQRGYTSETSFFDWETSSNEGISRLAKVKQNFTERKDASRARSSSNAALLGFTSVRSNEKTFSEYNHTPKYVQSYKPTVSFYDDEKMLNKVTSEVSSRVTSPRPSKKHKTHSNASKTTTSDNSSRNVTTHHRQSPMNGNNPALRSKPSSSRSHSRSRKSNSKKQNRQDDSSGLSSFMKALLCL